MANFKVTGNYLNPYEGLHAAYRGSPLYEQLGGDAAWETYARRGQLDEMITVLREQEKLGGVDKFKQNYNTDFLDTDQKMMAAANELYADRETVNKYKENYIDEVTGEVKERELEMTEYDWNKHNISALVDYNKKVYEREVEAKNKEDMNGFVKFMASIPGVLGEFGTGFLQQVENIWNPIQGTFNAVSATIKGENVDEAFQSAWKDDVSTDLRAQLEDWERKYTLIRDINGNYTTGGKIFGGIATSYGQFAPTMMLNFASGFVGKIGSTGSKLNNFSQSAAKVINKAANLMYWTGLSSSNFGEFVRDKEMATVPTWQKLLNAAAKGTGEYLVMRMLNNVFGTTTLDKLTFGYALRGSVAKTTAARVGIDFMHEGLEEALQDFSSYYVDVFFTSINENFGKYANYNLQTFIDAFVLGALSSIGGSAVSIVTGKRISKNEVARNRKGEIKVDRKGKVKIAKFNAFESYNIRANAEGFTSAVNELMNDKTLTKEQRNSLYGQAYATIRVLSSYYGEIGQERFAAAESLINQLYEYGTKKGYYWNEEKRTDIIKKLKQQYQDMSTDYYGKLEENVEAVIKEAVEKAAISEINQVIAKEDLKSGKVKLPADKAEMEKIVQDIFDKDESVERVVITNDGVTPIQVSNIVFVPSNYLELGADGNIVYRTIAEQDLVQKTISGKQYADLLPIILSTYRSVKNDPNATMEQAIFELYFNPQFFEIMLNSANQEMFQFLSKLNDLAAKATRKTVKDEIFVQRLNEVMVELNKILVVYLVNQQEANFDHLSFLNKKQKDWIHNKRYSKDLANRIIKGNKVTNEEWDVVKHRINAMPVTQDIKDVIWNNIQSKTESVRRNAITQMNNHYRNVFLSPYNGKTFLPNNSIANNTWNTWAKASGLTIDTLLVPVTDPDMFEIIQESEGEVSPESTLAYYRKTFERYTNGKYTFQYKNGMVKVDEVKRDTQYGYYRFNKEKQSIYSERSERNRTIVERSRNANRTLISEFVSDDVDDMSKSYVEIDDLIKNPELLKASIRKKIEQSPQKEVTPQTAFLYLRNETLRKTKGNTSIVMGSDGKFYFVNVKAAKNILINPNPDWQNKKEFKVTELVKADYMLGKLAGLKIVKGNSTYYDPQTNTIVLEQADNDTMTYLFFHEFQHAIQDNENLNRGLSATWLDSLKVDAQRKRIINDFRKHRPELFNDVKKGSKEEADIVQDSIYNMTGETQAYGLEADEMNDYYPVLSYVNNGTVNLVLPWGTHYKLNDVTGQSSIVTNDSKFESIVKNNTDDYSIEQFTKRPKSVFVMPDGSLRAVQKGQHHIDSMERIIANGYNESDASDYFKSLTQVSVQRDSDGTFVSVRIPLKMDKATISSLLTIMDILYDKRIEFDLGSTYGYDVDPSEIVVFSDEYDNGDDLLDAYINEYRNKNILRNSHKKRYVSNKEADESNLKYFKRRNKPIQLDPRVQELVKETTGHEQEVSRGLWKLIGGSRKGELNVHTLYEYIRTAETMNDYTFNLINKYFFKNTAIKSFKQLKAYASELAPKYYALRAVLKAFGKEQFLERKLSHKGFVDILENLEKRPEWKALYDQIVERFESYKGSLPLDIDYQNMRIMFMKMFDGTVQSAGHIAAIAKWLAVTEYTAETKYKTAGQVKKVSTEKSIGEDIKLEDTLEDESARTAFDEVLDDTPEIQMIEAVINERNRRFFESEDYKNMDKAEIRQTQYEIRQEVEEKLTAEEVRAEYLAILTGEDRAYNDYVKSKISKYVRPVKNVKAHIRYLVNVSIRNNLSESDMKRFRKQYPEVFDADGRLNPEYMKSKSMSQLEALEESLVKVADKAKEGAFKSAKAQRLSNDLAKAKRKIEKLEQENQKLKDENKELKQYEKTEDYKFDNDYEFTINSDIPMPAVVQETMETSFDEFSKSEVKYVGDDTVDNIKINMTKFFEKAGNKLSMMSQQDVDDVINFYAHSVVIAEKFDTNSMRKYDAFKMFTLAYLLEGEREGLWTLSESQTRDINNTLDQMARQSATVLSMWKQALKLADPNRCIINSIKRSTDVEFSTHAIESLSQAMSMPGKSKEQLDRKSAAVKKAIERLEYEALEQYKKKEGNVFDKLVKLQRLFMLSGPGTWIRNAVSNTVIIPANRGGAFIGTIITEKLFKHKKNVLTEHKQWRIAGTKPDQIFSDYVDNLFDWIVYKDDKGKDVTFYQAISDGLNKYNPKKLKSLTGVDAITDMIAKRVASDIFNNNGFTSRSSRKALKKSGELLNMTSKFVFKMLSDDPWIKRQTKYYMKRMLHESQKDINPTMLDTQDYPNKKISEIFVEAYKMATWDYMHKPNVFNKIEQWIREKSGAPGYFIFKQFLPFASAGWNWFIAGLELTPIGLAKGIIQYVKLEDMIQKMDKARVKGEDIASSRFAAYIARRNIGKGLIGTIGLAIGLILAFTGTAGIDEEDDKLKIRIGDNFYIDITDLFGSQGILLGMAIGSPFMDGEGTAWDKVSSSFTSTLTQLFNDSVYNDVAGWFKWNDGVGEVLLDRFESSIGTFIPNAIKTFNSMLYTHQVKYDKGILGAIERWGVQLVPGLAHALPKKVDVYDGQVKPKYNVNWLINFINRLGPIDIMPYKVTDMEKLAMSLGVNKDMLTGNYDDIGQLSAADVEKINKYYGTLNEQDLAELVANKRKYRVLDEETDKYVEITFNKMTDKQKKSVIQRIMSDNASAAKVYIWTSKGGKFYGTESEVQEYRKLGLNNVYVEMKGKKGFI